MLVQMADQGFSMWRTLGQEHRHYVVRFDQCACIFTGNFGVEPVCGVRITSRTGGHLAMPKILVLFEKNPVHDTRLYPNPWRSPTQPQKH